MIQQFGTPADIYERPSNIFVATFMGSPPMNVVRVSIEGSESTHVVKLENGGTIPVAPGSLASKLVGRKLLMGVRPEWFTVAGPEEQNAIDLPVEVVEPTGPDVYVELALGKGVMARLPANAPRNCR